MSLCKYTCGVCRKELEYDGTLPEVREGEIFLCPTCQEVIYRLTSVVIESEDAIE